MLFLDTQYQIRTSDVEPEEICGVKWARYSDKLQTEQNSGWKRYATQL